MKDSAKINEEQSYRQLVAIRDEMRRVLTSSGAVCDLMSSADLTKVNQEALVTLLNYLSERLAGLKAQFEERLLCGFSADTRQLLHSVQ